MQLFALGVNHRTAPLDIREQAAFDPKHVPEALRDAMTHGGAGEAAILSTCNRSEIYCRINDISPESVIRWLCDYRRLNPSTVRPYLYVHPGREAVTHAFRVASGLDSMVLGEPQILGQMKDAFTTAREAGTTGKMLNKLFQQTFAVAKQVRTDTAIGLSPVSVAFAAVALAKQIFNDLADQTVLLIGAGDMIELTAKHFREQNVTRFVIANRTFNRAQALAELYDGLAIPFSDLPDHLSRADIIVSCTASTLPILGKGAVERALRVRKHRPIFMIDMAVPRDIEVEVGDLGDVYLYTVDDLKDVVQENLESRRKAAREAEKIIDLEVMGFMRWVQSLDAVPAIRALRESAEAVRDAEIARAIRMLENGDAPSEVITKLGRSLTNKFTHGPTAALRAASHDRTDLLEVIRRLFPVGDED
ncbi:MAG: glutamyl-tRNA reductase [Acidiferrobacteraceae bacterium]|jgi:glutamyl-tRNA reductase